MSVVARSLLVVIMFATRNRLLRSLAGGTLQKPVEVKLGFHKLAGAYYVRGHPFGKGVSPLTSSLNFVELGGTTFAKFSPRPLSNINLDHSTGKTTMHIDPTTYATDLSAPALSLPPTRSISPSLAHNVLMKKKKRKEKKQLLVCLIPA